MGCHTRSRVLDWLSDGKEQTMSKDLKEWEKPPKAEPQKVITTCVTVPMAILEANEREKQDERQTKDGR